MKNIFSIYESITDDDSGVLASAERSAVTIDVLKEVIPKCIKNIDISPNRIIINPDGSIYVDRYSFNYLAQSEGIVVYKDLPPFIKFSEFSPYKEVNIVVEGPDVTTLKGLPENLSEFEIFVDDCPNLKDFGNIKTCKDLIIRCKDNKPDLLKFKKLPKATAFIRIKGYKGVDEKYISKISGTPKNKITVL